MGEEQGSQIRIFANGQEIASGIGEMKLTPSAEQPETEAPTDWNNPPSFEITGTITNDDQVDELINDIIRRSKFSRKEVKRMFYAVTHHQKVVFDIRLEFCDGTIKEGEIVCRLPCQLREFFVHTYHLRCPYRIENSTKPCAASTQSATRWKSSISSSPSTTSRRKAAE